MDIAQIGNSLEAVLWFLVATALLLAAARVPTRSRALLGLSASFAVFGLTDLVEIQSGAWWRPPWLLVVKGVCVITIASGIWHLARNRNSAASFDSDSEPPDLKS